MDDELEFRCGFDDEYLAALANASKYDVALGIREMAAELLMRRQKMAKKKTKDRAAK